jgi:hypothetical protein
MKSQDETLLKTIIISNRDSRVLRMGFDEREAWFEIQVININSQIGETKYKALRFDYTEAEQIINFITITKRNFIKRAKKIDVLDPLQSAEDNK